MGSKAKSRAEARKVKDKWRSKETYKLRAPEMFRHREIGSTLADEPEKLQDRLVIVSGAQLTGDMKQGHVKFTFAINEVRSYDAFTIYRSHQLSSDYLRRLSRRKRSKIDGIYDVTTQDGYLLRIKTVAISDRRIQSTTQTTIRLKMGELVTEFANQSTTSDLVANVLSGNLAKTLTRAVRKIYPVSRVEITKSRILKVGKVPELAEDLDLEALDAAEEEVEEEEVSEEEVVEAEDAAEDEDAEDEESSDEDGDEAKETSDDEAEESTADDDNGAAEEAADDQEVEDQ